MAVVRRAMWAFLVVAMLPRVAVAEEVRSRRSIPYSEARDTFRRLGYRPYLMPGADICDPDDPRCFPELEYCAKSRTWACTYTWRRGKTIIEVETRYDNPVVARSECVVNCSRASGPAPSEAAPRNVDHDPDRPD